MSNAVPMFARQVHPAPAPAPPTELDDGSHAPCRGPQADHVGKQPALESQCTTPRSLSQRSSRPSERHRSRSHAAPQLPTSSRRRLWGFVLVYQLINTMLLASLAALYGTATTRDSVLYDLSTAFLFARAQTFLVSAHVYASAGYALLALVFAHGALSMVWHSAKQRRLCFGPAPFVHTQPAATSTTTQRRGVLSVLLATITKLYTVHASFGLRGRYFTVGFFVREVIESALQTTQAVKSSRSLSNTFVNQSYGVLIFLNCAACALSPLLRRANPAKGRLLCVLLDLVLDFAWGSAIPLVVFWPYLQLYFAMQRGVTNSVEIDSVQREVEFILVLSTSDFVLSTFPFMSSAANMRSVKRLLASLGGVDTGVTAAHAPAAVVVAAYGSGWTAATETLSNDNDPPRLNCVEVVCASTRSRKLCERFSHGLFLLYGVVVLAISLASMSQSSHSDSVSSMCVHRVYPWLTTKQACVGRTIDCTAAGVTGSRTEITDVLLQFDEWTLANLVFTRCPQLEIPAEIHRFQLLSSLTIRDSMVLEWSNDASIAQEYFSELQTIRLRRTNFTSVPDGLVGARLSSSVEFMYIRDVYMAPHIDLVGENWQHLKYFYCDSCGLESFPRIVDTMSELRELSLMFNGIAAIEDRDTVQVQSLTGLWIDGSPLESLPNALWYVCSSDAFSDLSIQCTNVSHIPEWVTEVASSNFRVLAFGSPLCADSSLVKTHPYLYCKEEGYT